MTQKPNLGTTASSLRTCVRYWSHRISRNKGVIHNTLGFGKPYKPVQPQQIPDQNIHALKSKFTRMTLRMGTTASSWRRRQSTPGRCRLPCSSSSSSTPSSSSGSSRYVGIIITIQTNSLPIQLKLLLWLNFHRCRNGRKICDHKFRKQIEQNLSIPVANSCQHRPSAKLITTFPCHRCCFNSTSNMNKIKKVVKSELLEKEELILNLFF